MIDPTAGECAAAHAHCCAAAKLELLHSLAALDVHTSDELAPVQAQGLLLACGLAVHLALVSALAVKLGLEAHEAVISIPHGDLPQVDVLVAAALVEGATAGRVTESRAHALDLGTGGCSTITAAEVRVNTRSQNGQRIQSIYYTNPAGIQCGCQILSM